MCDFKSKALEWDNMDFHLINKDLYPVDKAQENENIPI